MSFRSDPAGPLLVLDVGHTSTAATLVDAAVSHPVPEPDGGTPCWPSAAFLDGGRLLVGTAAVRHRALDPAAFAGDVTRGLATGTPRRLGDRELPPVELVAALLSSLRTEAQRLAGAPVHRALMTAPAVYGPDDPWRVALLAAAAAAGLTSVEVLAAHLADAHAPAAGAGIMPDDLVLVYDLGGAHFAATLVRVGVSAPRVVGHARRQDCGGRDVDDLLARWITHTGRDWLGPLAADPGTAVRLSAAVDELARRMKHGLTDGPVVQEQLAPGTASFRLDRTALAALAAPVLQRTVQCCRELLDRVDVPAHRLAAIVLVGGGSRMPAVVDLLADAFGRPLRRAGEPELATVHGAVRWHERGGARQVTALDLAGRPVPLTFTLPGGDARVLRWLVTSGEAYAAGQVLGRVRLPGGGVWELVADTAGTVERVLAAPGATVVTGQWLVLART